MRLRSVVLQHSFQSVAEVQAALSDLGGRCSWRVCLLWDSGESQFGSLSLLHPWQPLQPFFHACTRRIVPGMLCSVFGVSELHFRDDVTVGTYPTRQRLQVLDQLLAQVIGK